ncbi:MAG: hypothetical protein J3R72DRAFT_429741 [Linnemannia gamsii]|nr:MAG: hypothetical protein J3R72DRAFT_429741 [Linnemannia gamsii]
MTAGIAGTVAVAVAWLGIVAAVGHGIGIEEWAMVQAVDVVFAVVVAVVGDIADIAGIGAAELTVDSSVLVRVGMVPESFELLLLLLLPLAELTALQE